MKFDRSLELLDQALDVIPKGSQTASKCHDQWARGTAPVFVEKASGCHIWDVDGNKFQDHMCALGPIVLGYNYPRVNEAVKQQLKKGTLFSLSSPLEIKLAQLIKEAVPNAEMVRFGKNGSDVTSIAIRIARSYTKKDKILMIEGNYHGWSDFFAGVSVLDKGLPPILKSLADKIPYNDLPNLEKALATYQYSCLIMEPICLDEPKPDYLYSVRELCSRYGVLLIFDELITGFRLGGISGAQGYYGVEADLVTYGKAIANGFPIAVLAGKKEYMRELEKGVFFSGTYCSDLIGVVAAIETISEMKEHPEIFTHIKTQGDRLREEFNAHTKKKKIPIEMFGYAGRHNIRFNTPDPTLAKDIYNAEMIKQGIFMGTQIYVNWAHTEKNIGGTIRASKNALNIIKGGLKDGNLEQLLNGERSKAIFKRGE